MMKSDSVWDSVFLTIALLAIVFFVFQLGVFYAERNQCKAKGGVYSFDYQACLKNIEVLK